MINKGGDKERMVERGIFEDVESLSIVSIYDITSHIIQYGRILRH